MSIRRRALIVMLGIILAFLYALAMTHHVPQEYMSPYHYPGTS